MKDTDVPDLIFQPKGYNSEKDLQEDNMVYFQKKDEGSIMKKSVGEKKNFYKEWGKFSWKIPLK